MVSYPPKLACNKDRDLLAGAWYVLEAAIHADADDAGNKASVEAEDAVGGESLLVYVQETVELACTTARDAFGVS